MLNNFGLPALITGGRIPFFFDFWARYRTIFPLVAFFSRKASCLLFLNMFFSPAFGIIFLASNYNCEQISEVLCNVQRGLVHQCPPGVCPPWEDWVGHSQSISRGSLLASLPIVLFPFMYYSDRSSVFDYHYGQAVSFWIINRKDIKFLDLKNYLEFVTLSTET